MNAYAKIFPIFESLLISHIATKTSYSQFHEKSAEFYELAFDCFHLIGEKMQDLGLKDALDDEDAVNQSYKDLMDLKDALNEMVKEKNSVWMDNLLRGLVDRAESACGNARAFIEEESDEYEKKPVRKSILPQK
jgi:regulator of replication initiation timing